jgi:hypothetical protein
MATQICGNRRQRTQRITSQSQPGQSLHAPSCSTDCTAAHNMHALKHAAGGWPWPRLSIDAHTRTRHAREDQRTCGEGRDVRTNVSLRLSKTPPLAVRVDVLPVNLTLNAMQCRWGNRGAAAVVDAAPTDMMIARLTCMGASMVKYGACTATALRCRVRARRDMVRCPAPHRVHDVSGSGNLETIVPTSKLT